MPSLPRLEVCTAFQWLNGNTNQQAATTHAQNNNNHQGLIWVGSFDRDPPPAHRLPKHHLVLGLVSDPAIDPLLDLDEFDQIDYFSEAFDHIGDLYGLSPALAGCQTVSIVHQLGVGYQSMANSLMVGLLAMWGMDPYEAVYWAAAAAGPPGLLFHNAYVALVDISLGLENKLLFAVEEFEATGITVGPAGQVMSLAG